jgi:hypothetical protein
VEDGGGPLCLAFHMAPYEMEGRGKDAIRGRKTLKPDVCKLDAARIPSMISVPQRGCPAEESASSSFRYSIDELN